METMTVGNVQVTVDDAGVVQVLGATSVHSRFSVKEDGSGGFFEVTAERADADLAVILKGDEESPLGKSKPIALVATLGRAWKVYGQHGFPNWDIRQTLFPKLA